MTVKIAPAPRQQFLDTSGDPYSGAKLFSYAAGTTTKQNTYTTSAGDVANSNPIVLDSSGRTPYGVWLTAGQTYKFVLAPSNDIDPPASPIFTEDNISGTNDTATIASAQWAASAMTPTYVSGTQFTVVGDQTSTLDVGRRLQLTVSAGTVYGHITTSAYTSLTTVTLVMDAGQALDAGLSAFNVSILSGTDHSVPKLADALWTAIGVVVPAANTTFSGNNTFSGISTFSGTIAGATPLIFEGVTADDYETSLAITAPTADRTITVPDANVDLGALLLLQNFRLTLETGVAVSTTDQTAKTTVYAAPYKGNRIALYNSDATGWHSFTSAEMSVAVPSTTVTPFDVFCYDNSGTPTLETTNWTNDTTRATALVLQDGVYCKTGALTRRYLGTCRTTGVSGECEDSEVNRFVWNYYNKVNKYGSNVFTTTRSTTSTSYVEINTEIRTNFVIGVAEDAVNANISASASNASASTANFTAIYIDTTQLITAGTSQLATTSPTQHGLTARVIPAVGFHYLTLYGKCSSSTLSWITVDTGISYSLIG